MMLDWEREIARFFAAARGADAYTDITSQARRHSH